MARDGRRRRVVEAPPRMVDHYGPVTGMSSQYSPPSYRQHWPSQYPPLQQSSPLHVTYAGHDPLPRAVSRTPHSVDPIHEAVFVPQPMYRSSETSVRPSTRTAVQTESRYRRPNAATFQPPMPASSTNSPIGRPAVSTLGHSDVFHEPQRRRDINRSLSTPVNRRRPPRRFQEYMTPNGEIDVDAILHRLQQLEDLVMRSGLRSPRRRHRPRWEPPVVWEDDDDDEEEDEYAGDYGYMPSDPYCHSRSNYHPTRTEPSYPPRMAKSMYRQMRPERPRAASVRSVGGGFDPRLPQYQQNVKLPARMQPEVPHADGETDGQSTPKHSLDMARVRQSLQPVTLDKAALADADPAEVMSIVNSTNQRNLDLANNVHLDRAKAEPLQFVDRDQVKRKLLEMNPQFDLPGGADMLVNALEQHLQINPNTTPNQCKETLDPNFDQLVQEVVRRIRIKEEDRFRTLHVTRVYKRPEVRMIDNLLTQEECSSLVAAFSGACRPVPFEDAGFTSPADGDIPCVQLPCRGPLLEKLLRRIAHVMLVNVNDIAKVVMTCQPAGVEIPQVRDMPGRKAAMRIMLTEMDEDAIDFYHLGFKVRPIPGLGVLYYPSQSADDEADEQLTMGFSATEKGGFTSLYLYATWK
ncbi:MAG: hypothetical protein KVP17_001184 [Porospora cf. gigantea B]|uniref:uncharacterized protein n=2 Tax=Porospora cf. gigantea B TaxID=2853592 RepID=UPI003571D3A8|nr:MAG: hypothetical protein KVP17_001184 [Porospora cf. gigantea B]